MTVVEYEVCREDAEGLMADIAAMHSSYYEGAYSVEPPAHDDRSLPAVLYWERDLMLSIAVGLALPQADGTVRFQGRADGNDLMEYVVNYLGVTILSKCVLEPFYCVSCRTQFWHHPDHRWAGQCNECVVLSWAHR